jgi:heme exporter protein CcmD
MDWSANHVGFVIAAYALSGAVLAALAALILIRNWSLRRELSRLERPKSHDG